MSMAGMFTEKKGKPTVVMKAIGDLDLYAWHLVFSFSGSLIGIKIIGSSAVSMES